MPEPGVTITVAIARDIRHALRDYADETMDRAYTDESLEAAERYRDLARLLERAEDEAPELELTAGQAAAIRGMRQTAPHTLTPHPTDPGALLVKDARGRHYHLTHTGAATRLTTEDETHA